MLSRSPLRRGTAVVAGLALAALFTPLAAGALLAPAAADTAVPAAVQLPATIAADALPTVQINGVVWSQLVVGNTVYVAGKFTSARPSGSPAGTNETARVNLLAYDLTTGQLKTTWAPPPINGDALTLAASADGSKIYVGGAFDKVGTDFTNNFQWRSRAAAFDATTGALVKGFAPAFGTTVRSIALVGNTLYAGGDFNAVNGTARKKLAAVNATTGATLPWAPEADAPVLALLPTLGGSQIVVGGRFAALNGTGAQGSGALDATTGATRPWAAQTQSYAYGTGAAITSLSTDGTAVFATGYAYYGGVANLENSYAAEADGGALRWMNACLGDTYSSFPQGGVLYTSTHAHDCGASGGFPELSPRQYQWAQAMTTSASSRLNTTNAYGWAGGTPGPALLPWAPTLTSGSFTGQGQASWSVAGNDKYVVYGGEFGTVNGKAQQGLTRFAVRATAPNKEGPQGTADLTPSATSTYPGQVRVAWRGAWDRDDAVLKYELLRGTANPVVVATTTASSAWWNRPPVALNDPSPAAGVQTYRVRVSDPSGNTVTGQPTTVTAAAGTGAYAQAVKADGATDYWRLGDRSGLVGTSSVGEHDLTVDASQTRGTAGATPDGDTAMTFTGSMEAPYATRFGTAYRAIVPAATTYSLSGPQTYTTETWIKTTTTAGGKIIGFGDSNLRTSGNYDRHVYMTDDGRLVAGVYDGSVHTATSSKSYNDGQWHQVVATLGSDGLSLYVDGVRVARDGGATRAQAFEGYWRLGGDNLGGWPSAPSSLGFAGAIDDVAVYAAPLTGAQVRAHYAASGRTAAVPAKPSDASGAAVYDSSPDAFWRLQETSGTALADSSPDGTTPATLNGSAALGAAGNPGATGSTAVSLSGEQGAGFASTIETPAPSTYSEELWFSTRSTRGGKLIGFGSNPTGYSGSYDRHVWMDRNGTLHFGTWTGQANTVDTTAAYNDGAWHHVVATQGAQGMALYVDGALVGTNAQTQAQAYTGYWRVGGDSSWGDTDNGFIDATVDDVAVYSRALSATDAASHFRAGGGNTAPTASFTSSATGLQLSVDASASTDADGRIASYAWAFGDGGTGTGATAQHAYTRAGTYTVTLTTTDDRGATTTSRQSATVRAASASAPTDAYGKAVYDAAPDAYYRLDDAAGSASAADASGFGNTGAVLGGARTGAPGVSSAVGAGTGATVDGQVGSTIVDPQRLDGPTTYSLELWFSTTSTRGGKIVGFGDGDGTGYSSNYDRHVIMNTDGTLHFGVWTGSENRVDTTTAYNDGRWHHLVAAQGPDGMVMYVDGASVGTNPQAQAQRYTGSWRVGGDSSWGPTQNGFFDGSVDEVALYSKVLGAATVSDHFTKGSAPTNQAPTAAFTATATDLTASVDASTSTDPDGTVASYAWDFGDGAGATGVSASHPYAAAGTYTATLVVTDDKGATATTTRQVVVTAVPNQAPAPAFASSVKDLTAVFDAAASSDADGTVASYAWDFGDGTTGTGAAPSHTYASAGARTVTLTVTDDRGAAAQVSHDITPTSPAPVNQAPTASFTSTTTNLVAGFDASASADSDGTLASYAWDFGDRGTGTGAKPSHTYAAAGSYEVVLTVTDDKGAKSSLTSTVTVTAAAPANKAPTASFTSTATGLVAAVDASASSDADGSIASYAWDFGDLTTGTGVRASRTYPAAGTYSVTLTVTDDKGATGSVTKPVVVAAAPPAATTVAADAFGRSLTGGWGAADTGGTWSTSGAASSYTVTPGTARMLLGASGTASAASLRAVSAADVDVTVGVAFDKAVTGGAAYANVQARQGGGNDYRAKVKVAANGAVTVALVKVIGGVETSLRSTTLTGVALAPGQVLQVRFAAVGSGTTTLSAKAWFAGTAEPQAWTLSTTDTTAALQTAGAVGLVGYFNTTTAGVAPVSLSVSGLAVRSGA